MREFYSPEARNTQPLLAGSLIALLILFIAGCTGAESSGEGGDYQYGPKNQLGPGKIYMNRQIANVMGHQGASWLDRSDRESEERTDLLLSRLSISAGSVVADIGAGTGYFSFPMARLVGDTGRVYAVDIQPEMLAIIQERVNELGVGNLETVLATEKDPGLAPESVDLVLFVDVYHELEWPKEVMAALYTSLVPGGRLVLVEYRAEDPAIRIIETHKMTELQARREMEAAGFSFVENIDVLPQQHMLIFSKPGTVDEPTR